MPATALSRRRWLLTLGGGLGLMALARTRLLLSLVNGDSMIPAFASGDLLVVDKLAYWKESPQRGDIVVANDSKDLIVKRVVGLPGEVVEVRQGRLHVNDSPLAEPYPVTPGRLSLRRGRLLDDTYALLGDNRSLSAAASVHAVLPGKQIVSRWDDRSRNRPSPLASIWTAHFPSGEMAGWGRTPSLSKLHDLIAWPVATSHSRIVPDLRCTVTNRSGCARKATGSSASSVEPILCNTVP
ncbi:MAG: signal peptidase I [Verrucomicrobia bacterium]|nr:signal peptidase I [Verrucomicrobiota bacterium]